MPVDVQTSHRQHTVLLADDHPIVRDGLATLLAAAGKSFGDVVMARVFLTRIKDFAAVNAIYAEQFEPPFPSRTTIGVAALPLGASVEVELLVRA